MAEHTSRRGQRVDRVMAYEDHEKRQGHPDTVEESLREIESLMKQKGFEPGQSRK